MGQNGGIHLERFGKQNIAIPTTMLTYHHIRYAKATRFGEPQILPFEEPTHKDFGVVACPQNRHMMGFVMGDGEALVCSAMLMKRSGTSARKPFVGSGWNLLSKSATMTTDC